MSDNTITVTLPTEHVEFLNMFGALNHMTIQGALALIVKTRMAEQRALTQRPAAQAGEREAFETAMRRKGWEDKRFFHDHLGYRDSYTATAWAAWQARASLPTQPAAQATPEPERITVQEAWEAAGGNPGIKASKADLLEALRQLDKVCDEATPEPVGEPFGYVVTSAFYGTCSFSKTKPGDLDGDSEIIEVFTRPAPGVPEGFDVQALTATGGGHKYPLIVVRDKSSQLGEDVYQDEHPVIYSLLSAWLAAAQAKGGE